MNNYLAALFLSAWLLPAADATEPHGDSLRQSRRTPVVEAVEKVHDSVVNISTERTVEVRRGFDRFYGPNLDFFGRSLDDFFRGPVVERRKVQTPLGSGCFITSDGLVVTNEHVVRRATNIKLSLDTGADFDAILLAADPDEDLALLRAQSPDPVHDITMGTSSDLMLGETVIALGNPFGFKNSVTSGIISAFNREIEVSGGGETVRYSGLIQTSALINPGNSGGPLVNVLGQLIGINTAVVDRAQGIGFAIPIDRCREVLAPLLASPQVSEAWPGITGVTTEGRKGTTVTEVDPKGPARGVLQAGDIIRQVDGREVKDLFDFLLAVVQHEPDDSITLQIMRDETPRVARLVLGRMPVPSPKEMLSEKLGIAGQGLTPTLASQLGGAVDYGVLVSQVRSNASAAESGIRQGDVIVQIGRQRVRSLRDAAAALAATRPGERVFLLIVRGNRAGYTRVTID